MGTKAQSLCPDTAPDLHSRNALHVDLPQTATPEACACYSSQARRVYQIAANRCAFTHPLLTVFVATHFGWHNLNPGFTDELLVYPGNIKLMEYYQLLGLPFSPQYSDEDPKLKGSFLPYFILQRLNMRNLGVIAEASPLSYALTLTQKLKASLNSLSGPAAAADMDASQILRRPPALFCAPSGAGKTVLINSFMERGRRPDAKLKEAYMKDPTPKATLTENHPDMSVDMLAFDPMTPGVMLSLETFEKFVQGTEDYKQAMQLIIEDVATRLEERSTNRETILLHRGPFVSLPETYTSASTFAPMLVDSHKEDYFEIEIRFRDPDDCRRAIDEAAMAWRRQQEDPAEDTLGGNDAMYYAKLGFDMLGFGGKHELPARLDGKMDPGLWTLPMWYRLFVGKTLRIKVTSETWQAGCERVHDILMLYTRDSVGLWAMIDVCGMRVLAPASLPSPLLDAQGPLTDNTSRNGTLARTLVQAAPHAFVFLLYKEVDHSLRAHMRDDVCAALDGEAAICATAAASQEAVPKRIMAVHVADKYAQKLGGDSILARTTDPRNLKAQAVRADLRSKMFNAFRTANTAQDLFQAVACHSVTPLRKAAFGMEALEADLSASFKRTQDADFRRMVHALLGEAENVINLYEAYLEASKSINVAPQLKTRLDQQLEQAMDKVCSQCTRQEGGTKESAFEVSMGEILENAIGKPLYEELRDILSAAAHGDETQLKANLVAALNDSGVGPQSSGLVADVSKKQLQHLNNCSRDSVVLAAMLEPLLGVLSSYGSKLALKASGHALGDEMTDRLVRQLLANTALLDLVGKRLDVNKAEERARVPHWLFVQGVRGSISRSVNHLLAALASITEADLRQAAYCCSAAWEHYQFVGVKAKEAGSKGHDLHSVTARNASIVAQLPEFLNLVAESMAERVGTYFYDFCYFAAERAAEKCLQASNAAQGGDFGGAAGLMLLSNPNTPSKAGPSTAAQASAGASDMLAAARADVKELYDLLDRIGFAYNKNLLVAQQQPQPAAQIFAYVTRSTMKRKRDEDLDGMSMDQLRQRARDDGHKISGNERRPTLERLIREGPKAAASRSLYR